MGIPLKYKQGDIKNGWVIKEVILGESVKYRINCSSCNFERIVSSGKMSCLRECILCKHARNRNSKIGQRVGNFEILDIVHKDRKVLYKAKCKCGNEFNAQLSQLKKNKTCRVCVFGNYPGRIVEGCTILEKSGQSTWKILCRCGNTYISVVRFDKLKGGISKFRDCGCTKNDIYWTRIQEKIGMKFGLLKVIGVKKGHRHHILVCKCKCGNTIEFINGHECKRNSCGCLLKTNSPRNDRKGNARFKNYEVLSMRELYQSGNYSVKDLSKMFECSENYMLRIVKGLIWKNLDCPMENKKRKPRPSGLIYKKRSAQENLTDRQLSFHDATM